MIGTIRKHSKGLWWVIGGLTVISFLYWGASVPTRGGGGHASGDYGSIYGQKVSQQEFDNARREFYLFYWFHNPGEWPTKMSQNELERETYIRVLLFREAEKLGIHVSDDAAATAGLSLLHSIDRSGRAVSLPAFVKQILNPEGLTEADFVRFAKHDLAIQQLIETLGLTGELVTPQEATADYMRAYQERTTEAVFFSASNYLSQVTVTPAAIAQFYTNDMADYRLPDRVQVSYVEFNVSNFFAAAEQTIGKTNLDDEVQNLFSQNGMESVPDAKTPEEAKAKIREYLLHKEGMAEAQKQANDLATEVFNQTPVRAENLAAIAKKRGLAVKTTAPFDSYGPTEFPATESFTKAAFALSPDDPFAGPILTPNAVYVIALDKQLPTEIPSLDAIRDRVTHDYKMELATALARRAGTNFVSTLHSQLMAGHSFAAACIAAGFHPEVLPPFSLSTDDLPELAGRASLTQLQQATFGTPVGHASGFEPTADGGFIVYVQKQLPVDAATMNAAMPRYLAGLRRARQNEVFNMWLGNQARRELGNIPAFQQAAEEAAK
jgi:peptidyl-prolyl cis-trans isomerase D